MTVLNTLMHLFPVALHLRAPTSSAHVRAALIGGVLIEKGHPLWLDFDTGCRIDCLNGSVWITRDGDPKDVVLSAGQSCVADRTGPVLFTALDPATVSFAPAVAQVEAVSCGHTLAEFDMRGNPHSHADRVADLRFETAMVAVRML